MKAMSNKAQKNVVWELHMAGMPMSEISKNLHVGAEFVRATICSVWADDRLEVKDAA